MLRTIRAICPSILNYGAEKRKLGIFLVFLSRPFPALIIPGLVLFSALPGPPRPFGMCLSGLYPSCRPAAWPPSAPSRASAPSVTSPSGLSRLSAPPVTSLSALSRLSPPLRHVTFRPLPDLRAPQASLRLWILWFSALSCPPPSASRPSVSGSGRSDGRAHGRSGLFFQAPGPGSWISEPECRAILAFRALPALRGRPGALPG